MDTLHLKLNAEFMECVEFLFICLVRCPGRTEDLPPAFLFKSSKNSQPIVLMADLFQLKALVVRREGLNDVFGFGIFVTLQCTRGGGPAGAGGGAGGPGRRRRRGEGAV